MARIPILLYHDIESPDFPNEKSNSATLDTVVDVGRFEEQMHFLAGKGYQSLSLRELFEYRVDNIPIPPNRIIITFDDGHYSNYHLAFPILQKYGFTGVFFVIADRVDHTHHLTRDQLIEMVEQGMEIGSHGLTHSYLPLLERAEVERELTKSRHILEDIIHRKVDYFAYPGGHYSKMILDAMIGAGYKGACSCLVGLTELSTNAFLLKRIEIRKRTVLEDFEHIFNPSHILFYQCVDFWKSSVRRLIGLKAYTRLRSRFYKYYFFKR